MNDARYQLLEVGVLDKQSGNTLLPGAMGWSDYLAAVANGDPIDGATPSPVFIEKIRAELIASINAICDEQVNQGATFNGNPYQTDLISRTNLTGVVAAVSAGVPLPGGFVWRDANNVNQPFDAPTLIALGGTVLARSYACYVNAWTLKAALTTAPDPRDIDLTQGWPS